MKKTILIDATTISEKTDGLTQYIINLLKNFPDNCFDKYNFSVLINEKILNKEFNDLLGLGKFKIIKCNISAIGPKRDIGFFLFFMRNYNSFDVFHSTSNQYPLSLKKGIATVHDITFEMYFRQKWWTFNFAKHYLSLIVKQSLNNAKHVIAVSNHTRNFMISKYKLSKKIEDKIEVIYEGWEHLIDFNNINEYEEYKNNYGSYFFYVGTTKEHKNMKRLLEAYEMSLKNLPHINLVLCGSEAYLSIEEKKLVSKINSHKKVVFFTGYVLAENLRNLFKSADAFIFPSLSEGFGIPVLETFYFEKPLLCSQTTSLPEIAGDAALYFDPESAEDISRAMIYFYNHPEIAEILIAKGKERLKEFSWKKAALETIAVYDKYFHS